MFYGHIGVALAAKPLAPKVSVGVMLVAATTIDTLCGVFTAFGIEWVNTTTYESHLTWSHGLFMSLVWTLLTLGIAWLVTKNWKMSLVVAGLVFSHWVLDFISHPMGMGKVLPKDLPLFFDGSPKVGLGLYSTVAGALISEFGLLAAGIYIYLKTTRPIDHIGKWAFAVLILMFALFPLTMFLPGKLTYLATFVTLLFLPVGIWMERHRKVVAKSMI
jgi:membrane-bound metal-dependent hydrolase YbcI (DUF457 family)